MHPIVVFCSAATLKIESNKLLRSAMYKIVGTCVASHNLSQLKKLQSCEIKLKLFIETLKFVFLDSRNSICFFPTLEQLSLNNPAISEYFFFTKCCQI